VPGYHPGWKKPLQSIAVSLTVSHHVARRLVMMMLFLSMCSFAPLLLSGMLLREPVEVPAGGLHEKLQTHGEGCTREGSKLTHL